MDHQILMDAGFTLSKYERQYIQKVIDQWSDDYTLLKVGDVTEAGDEYMLFAHSGSWWKGGACQLRDGDHIARRLKPGLVKAEVKEE